MHNKLPNHTDEDDELTGRQLLLIWLICLFLFGSLALCDHAKAALDTLAN